MKKLLLSLTLVTALVATTPQDVNATPKFITKHMPSKKTVIIATVTPMLLLAATAVAIYYVGKHPELAKHLPEIVKMITAQFAEAFDANVTRENTVKLAVSLATFARANAAKLAIRGMKIARPTCSSIAQLASRGFNVASSKAATLLGK
jgi:hypothetical protein